jgi:hypothetical protein
MTSYDGTNCNPITDERDKPILKENGYIFMDMVQLGLLNNLKGTADFARALASFLSARAVETEKLGGKTRKHGKRKSRKSKRRYRK